MPSSTPRVLIGFLCVALLLGACKTQTAGTTLDTRIGALTFTHGAETGYPTEETVELLFDAIDFQRAAQAYIWATPLVSFAQWKHAYQGVLGAGNGQILFTQGYDENIGGLTYNVTTPYALVFVNVSEEPWVFELPEGPVRGAAHSAWQLELSPITEPGKYLLVAPGQDAPSEAEAEGYRVVRSSTNNVFVGIRLTADTEEQRMSMLDNVNVYPWSERAAPNPRAYMRTGGKPWSATAPRGLEYWQRLSDVLNQEPVAERDRFFMAMLRPLGIEKGKPFAPDARQRKILEEGALVGEAMAKAIDISKSSRLAAEPYLEGSMWDIATTSPATQRYEHYEALDGRTAWFYEAVTNNQAMHAMENDGKGQVYLVTYKDGAGDWLDGGQSYVLHLPSEPPAELFWSITLYEISSRTIIQNRQKKADLGTHTRPAVNADGSIDLYLGPRAPEGKENNWVQTVEGRSWFPYFRFYSPKPEVVRREWVLPDIEKNRM